MLVDDSWFYCNKTNNQRLEPVDTMNANVDDINENKFILQAALDKMIEDGAKSEGHKQKYKEMHQLNAIKETNIQKREKIIRILTGKLASSNMFCLDNSIRNKMIVDDIKKKNY
jgi:hypothetical protein